MKFWNLYFVYDNNMEDISLRQIFGTSKKAVQALDDCWIDSPKNDFKIKTTSFCIVFTYDSMEEVYKIDRDASDDFIKKLKMCPQCNKVNSKLDKEICVECMDNFTGCELYRCSLCNKERRVLDKFNRELFGTLRYNNKDYKICYLCSNKEFHKVKELL